MRRFVGGTNGYFSASWRGKYPALYSPNQINSLHLTQSDDDSVFPAMLPKPAMMVTPLLGHMHA